MKIVGIGDPHGSIPKVPNADLYLITGDLGDSSLARKLAWEQMQRLRKGLPEEIIPPAKYKEAQMLVYNSSISFHSARLCLPYLGTWSSGMLRSGRELKSIM